MTFTQTYEILGKTYTLRFFNGIHIVVDDLTGEILFEGWRERCIEYIRQLQLEAGERF